MRSSAVTYNKYKKALVVLSLSSAAYHLEAGDRPLSSKNPANPIVNGFFHKELFQTTCKLQDCDKKLCHTGKNWDEKSWAYDIVQGFCRK